MALFNLDHTSLKYIEEEPFKLEKEIQEKIESFKDVKDIQQKIKIEMDKNNEDIDTRGDSFNVWKCDDFYKEMKKFSDTITID